jgi:hypothetical protein
VNAAVDNYLGGRAPRLRGNSATAFPNLGTVVDPLRVAMWLPCRSRLKRSITPTALGTKLYAGVTQAPHPYYRGLRCDGWGDVAGAAAARPDRTCGVVTEGVIDADGPRCFGGAAQLQSPAQSRRRGPRSPLALRPRPIESLEYQRPEYSRPLLRILRASAADEGANGLTVNRLRPEAWRARTLFPWAVSSQTVPPAISPQSIR